MEIQCVQTGPLGVNTYIVPLGEKSEGEKQPVFIVDPACCSFSDDEAVLVKYLHENKLELIAIVLTHGHFDHVAGLPVLKKKFPQVPVFIHPQDAPFLGRDSGQFHAKTLYLLSFDAFLPYVSNLPEADGFLEEGESLRESMESFCVQKGIHAAPESILVALSKWKIVHTPGHTAGSVCLYNGESAVLLSGDTVFYYAYGRTDLPGGSEPALLDSVKKLRGNIPGDTLVFPGHDRSGFALDSFY